MNRETILREIQRVALENGGVAPGRMQFERQTGITEGVWRGRIWLRWNDAIVDAGFKPRQMQEAHPDEFMLACLAKLTRSCGHFPTQAERRMARVRDSAFPNDKVFARLGDRSARIEKLIAFCVAHVEWSDILPLLPTEGSGQPAAAQLSHETVSLGEGYVYMLKLGRHYKIGKTLAVPRRHRQISLELPEKPDVVHSMSTDDPEGIEAYWHRRFAHKQTNGEWFALDAQDIRAFKRRKFM